MFLIAHIKSKEVYLVINTIHIKHLVKFMKYFEYLYDADTLEFQLITQDELIGLLAYQLVDSVEAFEELLKSYVDEPAFHDYFKNAKEGEFYEPLEWKECE